MLDLNFPVTFGAGLVSFFAPCVIPLLPAYVGYVTGVSVKELQEKGYAPFRKKMVVTSILYILGFSVVFVLLGAATASIGGFFIEYAGLIQRVGGAVILVLGLEFAGILKLPFLAGIKQFTLPLWTEKLGHARAFFVGVVFATAWTPCVGAVLGSILTLAATTGMAVEGATLLFVYSLGISLPFLIVSLTLASAPKYLKVITRRIDAIAKTSGLILVALGLLLLTDSYKYLNSWLFELAFKLGYEIK